jgi:hypothetical protein
MSQSTPGQKALTHFKIPQPRPASPVHNLPGQNTWRTIYGYARRWAAAGVVGVIRDQLRREVRLAVGKTPRAASAIVDSQSVKASETVGKDSRGWDGGKKSMAGNGI